ncbi:hypothetical protein Tco_0464883 [Tanacetum coccineum]
MWEVGFMIVKGLEWCGESTRVIRVFASHVLVGYKFNQVVEKIEDLELGVVICLVEWKGCGVGNDGIASRCARRVGCSKKRIECGCACQ